MRYSYTKKLVKLQKWLRKIKPLDQNREWLYKTAIRSITKKRSELLCIPLSNHIPNEEARYIIIHGDENYSNLSKEQRWNSVELFIIITPNCIHVKNHTFQYVYNYDPYYTDKIFKIFDRRLLKSRKAMENAMEINDKNSIYQLLINVDKIK
jgi:hypothetical protein